MLKRFILGGLAILFCVQLQAQQDLTIYNMDFIPQSNKLNPATRPFSKFYIGLPVPSLYISGGNNGFVFKDLLVKDQYDSLDIDFDHFIGQHKDLNQIHLTTNIDLLNFGFRIKEENYFTFNASTYIDFRFNYPKNLLDIVFEGNGKSLLGNTMSLNGLGPDLVAYHEFALGYSRQLMDERLTVGGKLKYLKGIANIWTETSDVSLATEQDNFFLTTSGDLNLLSASVQDITDETSDVYKIDGQDTILDIKKVLLRKNNGFAIDLGGRFKINDQFEVSASVLDIGFINWNVNPFSYERTKSTFEFRGIDPKDYLQTPTSLILDSTTIDRLQTEFPDTLTDTFLPDTVQNSYKKWLYTKFYIGGTYNIDEKQTAGVLFFSEIYKGSLRPAVSLQYQIKVKKWLSASANYSIYNRSAMNLGLGLSANAGPVQLYLATDNILAASFNKYGITTTDSTGQQEVNNFLAPRNAKNLHFRVGMNITIGRKKKDKDEDGITDKKDACPDVAGLAIYKGCPDTDKDSIPDNMDDCPLKAGLAQFKGCPDTDSDGIIDRLDSCATVAGIPEFNGCPDIDGDGIIDKLDSCATEPGPVTTDGCPDADDDGIKDTDDACPDKFGPIEKQGCPDTDEDGLHDNEDDCPEEAGPVENNGCPWADKDGDSVLDKDDKCPSVAGPINNAGCPFDDLDGDGVVDKDDRCPNTPGLKENEGCPEIKEEEQEVLNTAFSNLEFESGKDIIKEHSFSSLEELAGLLVKKPTWKLLVEGHTDSQGAAKSNLILSQKRAKALKKFLMDKGITDERIITKGYGETKPISTNSTAEGRQKNRRVEMTVVFE